MNNFILGLGIGLAAGVLLAPRSGEKTRQLLSSKAAEGSDYLADQAQQLKDSANDLVEQGRKVVADQKDRFADAAKGVQNAYQR